MEVSGICSICGGLAKPALSCRLCGALCCSRCLIAEIGMCRNCASKVKR